MERNFLALKIGYANVVMQRIMNVSMFRITEKWIRAEKEYGIFDLWKINAVDEGMDELTDGLSYYAKELLQEHFSTTDAQKGL